MPTPTRILRALAEELDPTLLDRNPREESQFQRIITHAPELLTRWGTERTSFTALAAALHMGAGTLRHHFVDIPALLGYLIRDHLRAISAILAQVPGDTPDRPRQRRAAYLEFTRTPLGAYTDMHALMLNNLPILPDDVRVPLIDHRNQVATALAPPDQAGFVLSMIDNPLITPSRLEAAIGTRQDTRPAADEALPPPRERIGEPTDGDIRRPRLPSGARPSATTTREAIVLEFTGRPRTRPH